MISFMSSSFQTLYALDAKLQVRNSNTNPKSIDANFFEPRSARSCQTMVYILARKCLVPQALNMVPA